MAHPMGTMCSVILAVLKQESNKSSQSFPIELLPSFIEDSGELQSFGSDCGSLAGWIGHINSCLNSSKTRLEGVSLLGALVSQCPLAAFQQHCVSWVRLLTQILQSHDPPAILSLACTTLRCILKDAAHVPELSRQLSNGQVPLIISAVLELKTLDAALVVISACIEYFPGPCGAFRSRIENFLVQLMGCHDNTDLAVSAGRCLALLARVGGGGQAGTKHTEAWSYYCYRVLASMRGVVDDLYSDSEPVNPKECSAVPLGMPSVPLNEPVRTYTLVRQFKVLCACLQNLLRAEFPEIVKVPVDRVLTLCYRVLGLNGKMLSKKVTIQWTLLAGSLPKLHSEAFNLLSALITSCHSNLVPHGHMINKLFVQALGWTMSGQSDGINQRSYSGLRVAAYMTLEIWLETVGTCSAIEAVSEKLLEQILYDAQPQTQTTKLKVTSDKSSSSLSTKSPGKTKQKGRTTGAENSLSLASQRRYDPLANSHVCLASLKVLRCLLLSAGTRVKPDLHKEVHEFIIPLLLRIQQATCDLTPDPYSCTDCRKALYRALLATVISPHPRWPPPLHCATTLFSRGRQDSSIKVASFCAEASIICQNIIHPRVPCLQKPLSIADLDYKRAPSHAEAKHDHLGINGGSDPTSRADRESGPDVFSPGGLIPTPVQTDVSVGSKQSEQDVSAVHVDLQPKGTEETDSSSDEDSADPDIGEDDQEIRPRDHPIKQGMLEIKQINVDNPEEPSVVKLTQDSLKEGASTSKVTTESVVDVEVSSLSRKEIDHSVSSSDGGKVSSLRRRSKRQVAQLKDQGRSKMTEAKGREGSGRSKRRKKGKEDKVEIQEEEIVDGDKMNEDSATDGTDAMLATFVDSLPDQD